MCFNLNRYYITYNIYYMCVVASIAMKCEVNSSFRINVDYFLNTTLFIH